MSGVEQGSEDIEAGGQLRATEKEGGRDIEERLREVKQSAFEGEGINNDKDKDVEVPPTDSKGGTTSQQGGPAATVEPERIVVSDPISESYRSIVEAINRTSDGFREGKKWKCVAGTPIKAESSRQQQSQYAARPRDQRKSQKSQRKSHKSQMTRSHTTEEGSKRPKRLVRQAACAAEDSAASTGNVCSAESQQLLPPAPTAAHLRGRSLPVVRQWTVDASCPPAIGQAYLLRPVSRCSIKSSPSGGDEATGGGGRRLSPADLQSSSAAAGSRARSRSPMPERIRQGSSFNVETNDGATVSVRSTRSGSGGSGLSATGRQHRLKKQRTCDSAPMRGGGSGGNNKTSAAAGGSNRHLPRQFSNASAYSAAAFIPTSISHQGMTLVRGASCSLVDIPTYLGPSYGGVELAQICDVRMAPAGSTAKVPVPAEVPLGESSAGAEVDLLKEERRKSARPRLQLDLTRKTNEQPAGKSPGGGVRETHRTVLCVGVTLVMLAVTLVGTMLSVGSRYQEMVFAKQWDWEGGFPPKNGSSEAAAGAVEPFTPLGEPFVIIPDDGSGGGKAVEEEGASDDPKNETNEYGGPSLALHQLPFYVDYLDP